LNGFTKAILDIYMEYGLPEMGTLSCMVEIQTIRNRQLMKKPKPKKSEPNKALEPTRLLVTDRAPSSTLRAK
jgi:hypothetical protein